MPISNAPSASACANVRGKPSKIYPDTPFSSSNCSRIRPITISSVTSCPASITAATLRPISVPELFAARNISPVDNCIMLRSSTNRRACVPLPAPGGPRRIIFISEKDLCVSHHDLCHGVAIFQSGLHIDAPANEIGFAE